MRVTGGKAKGLQLKTLPRHLIRPTTNLARQAIFSLLENTATTWCRALDLYAGTGALGIEALSRNVEWVDFVDHRKNCCDIIKYNLEKTGGLSQAHVYCCSVTRVVTLLSNDYDVVFIDPPYSNPSTNELLMNLAKSKLLGENSTVVVCHGNRFPLNPNHDELHLIKQRRYGDTFISIYQKGGYQ
jgi:16S rRNA (guanine(966)-N(2))-methyltransferase RsmD